MIGTFIYHPRNIDNQQKGDLLIDYSNVAVIFEEVELYFHPEYQKSYLNYLLKQLERAHIKKLEYYFGYSFSVCTVGCGVRKYFVS